MPTQTALLVIAHGSRREAANDDVRFLAAELARCGPYPAVVAAFLELAQPDLDGGATACVEQGARRVILLPHFLFEGTHVRRDLAAARDRFAERYPDVEFRLAEPLGRHPRLIEILVERARVADL